MRERYGDFLYVLCPHTFIAFPIVANEQPQNSQWHPTANMYLQVGSGLADVGRAQLGFIPGCGLVSHVCPPLWTSGSAGVCFLHGNGRNARGQGKPWECISRVPVTSTHILQPHKLWLRPNQWVKENASPTTKLWDRCV